RFDRRKADLRKALEHARAAQVRDGLHSERASASRSSRLAAVPSGGTGIASRRDVKRDRQVGRRDHRSQPIELRQVVVRLLGIPSAPLRLAWKREAAGALETNVDSKR